MREDANAVTEGTPVEPEQVRAQLARILRDASFVAAPLLGEFLRFVVESALAGDGRDKEYTIAVEVLRRGTSFDPKNDNSVRVHARRLRQRLDAYYQGLGSADPVVIEVPKGHYRAVFRLRRKDEDATRADASRLRRALSIGAAILLSGAVALWFSNRLPQNDTEASILVLPFQNLSDSPDTDYFARGVHEDLLTRLARIHGLKVISRRTAQSLAESKMSVVDMAAKAGVTRVLEGSIRRTADRVLLTVQLIAVPDERHVWAEKYDSDLADMLAVEDELARSMADALRIRLDAKVIAGFAKARTTSIEAYDLVLGVKDEAKTRSPDKIKIRIANLERAIELDPNYADAYATLAAEGIWCWAPESLRSDVVHNVEKALSLDPDNAEALMAMANVLAGRGQTERGREYLDRALAAEPGNAMAHIFYADYSSNYQDRWRHMEEAYRLDPVGRADFLVRMLLTQNRDGEALQAAKALLALAPDTPQPYEALAKVYFARGDDVEGLRQLRHSIELSCDADAGGFALALAERGQSTAAQRWLETIHHGPRLDALMLLGAANADGLEALLAQWLAEAPRSPEALTFYAFLQARRADEAYDRNDTQTRQARLNDALASFRDAPIGDDALLTQVRWLTVAEQAGDDALATQLRSHMREVLRVRFAPAEQPLERAMLAALAGDRDQALDEFERAIVPGQWCLPVLEVHGVLEDRGGVFHGVAADPRFQKLIAGERQRRAELNDRIANEAPDLRDPPHLGAAT